MNALAAMFLATMVVVPNLARPAADAESSVSKLLMHGFGNRTIGEFITELDSFYYDYINTSISISEAMIVVARSMDGTSDAEIPMQR